MADNSFKIVARLDINESAEVIKTDIKTLEKIIQSDKNTRLKIIAGLEIGKSKKLIQSQLATITNQANAPTIKVGVEVGNVQQSIDTVADKVKADGKIKIAPVVDVNVFMKNIKSALGVEGAEIKKAYQEYLQQLTLNPNDEQAILISYENLKDSIQNAMQIVPQSDNSWETFETIVKNCTTYISDLGSKSSETTNGLKAIEAQANQTASAVEKIAGSAKSYQSSIGNAITDLNKLSNNTVFKNNASNPEVIKAKEEIANLIAEYQKLLTQLRGDVTPEGLKAVETELAKLNSCFNTTSISAKNLQTALADTNGVKKQRQQIDLLITRVESLKKTNPKALKTFGGTIDGILSELKSGNVDNNRYAQITKDVQLLEKEIKLADKAGKTFWGRLEEQASKFGSWMTLTGFISGAWHDLQKMVTNVIELDNSLLELSKVSDLSAEGLRNITKEAYSLGKEVGKTGTQVIDAITNFKRAGFSIKDSTNFAEDALILTNVAEGINDAGEAATALISIMKGYGDTTPEFSQKILDAINQVSNTQAINFDDLVDGSQRLSAVAKQAGSSFEQMLGILTGTNEVLQNIEKTASGEITIFTRLQGIQLPDEEDVMPIAKLQETINNATKGAANVVDQSTGELRNVYDILDDINEVWDTLDKNTQEGIAFAAAGTRQKNVFLSMMENWENVESATESAMNSMGSSAEENQKYLDSIQGRLANMESAFQSLSNTVVNSDLIKGVVDIGTGILNFLDGTIDKLGTIPTLLTAISAGLTIKNVGELLNTPSLVLLHFNYRGYTRFKIMNSLIAEIG